MPLARAGTADTMDGLEYRDGGGLDSFLSRDKDWNKRIGVMLQDGSMS